MNVSPALLLTAVVFTIAMIVLGIWVADNSVGRHRRAWHRPLVATVGAIAGALYIAAAWVMVLP